ERGPFKAEISVSERSCREDSFRAAGFLAFIPTSRRRGDQASHASEGDWSMDGAHVPDLLFAASECAAHRRLRCTDGRQKALQEAQPAQAKRHGENRKGLGALPVRCLLVYVAQLGYQDAVRVGITENRAL